MAFFADPRRKPRQQRQPRQPDPASTKIPTPDDFEKDRDGKYAKYFKGNEILPIPEIAEKLTPRILSLVISDLKTKRLVGLKKETFEDVLLPTEEQAAKAAANNIITKHFRLQPEYKGTRRLRVTVCNVPAYITEEVLAAYLSAYGKVEEFLCLTRNGFKATTETLISGDRQMLLVVDGRCPRC